MRVSFEAQQLGWRPIHELVKCHSVISGTVAALAKKKTDKQQNAITAQQNASQLMLDIAARGGPLSGAGVPEELQGIESALLPYYFGVTEKNLSSDAAALYQALKDRMGPSDVRIAEYDDLLGRYDRASEANDKLVEDLALGNLTEQALAESAPVFNARRGVAESRRNSSLEALQETLNEIDAIQAGKGYSGDSTGNRMLRFNARRQIGNQTAADLAGVNLQNAMDERTIREAGRQQRIGSIDLPNALAIAAAKRKQLPISAVASERATAMQPFDFFRIQPGQFSQPNQLKAADNSLIANSIGQATSTIGGALLKYYTNQDLKKQAAGSGAANQYSDWASNYDADSFGSDINFGL